MSGGSQGSSGSIAGMSFPGGPAGMRRAALQTPGAQAPQPGLNFGMSNPQQSIPPLGLTQPQNPGGMANQGVLAQLEGRYVAPTGAGFQHYRGGSINPPFNPLMLQQMLQQKLQEQQAQQAQQAPQQQAHRGNTMWLTPTNWR